MCTPCGTVQWTVLPMGLKNAPSMFQKMMETILFQKHKCLDLQEFCSIYIDDLLIATPLGKNFDECLKLHEEQVRKVLEVLRQEKLVCGPKKGKMFLQSVEFCVSVLEDGTRRTGPRENGCPASAVDLAFMLDRISCFRTLVSSSGWSVVHSAVVWPHHPWCEHRSAVLRIGADVGADDDTLNAVDMIFSVVDVVGIFDIVDESSYVLVRNGQIEDLTLGKKTR